MSDHLSPVSRIKHGFRLSIAAGMLLFSAFRLQAQDHSGDPNVVLHVNPELGMCDFDIASNLTQPEWKKATREFGSIVYLDPLASARPMGKSKWSLQLEHNSAGVDQESGAWNNTFHHPDSTHYLTESGRIAVPGLRFKYGITERWEAGIYYTTAKPFGANYGFLALESKYTFLDDTAHGWAAAARGSFCTDANIRDFNVTATGLDVIGSKTFFRMVTPYAGASLLWSRGREVTDEVNLVTENSVNLRAFAGLDLRWRFLTLGYEFQFGDGLANRALKVGVIF